MIENRTMGRRHCGPHPAMLAAAFMVARHMKRHHHGRGKHEPWGPPFGKRWGGGGHGGGPGGRRFGKGDLKYVILDLLREQPRHGYDVIRAMEERFGGFYSPSPGSVYPTLQLLEDQGYVRSSEQDGKRIYTITDEGRAFLEERSSTVDDIRARMHAGFEGFAGADMRDMMQEMRQMGQMLMGQISGGALKDPEKMRKLREVFERTRKDIESVFRDDKDPNDTPPETI